MRTLQICIAMLALGCTAPAIQPDAAIADVAGSTDAPTSDVPVATDTQSRPDDTVIATDAPMLDAVTQADTRSDARGDAAHATIALPPPNAGFDYQLGGAYAPPAGVGIVSRDRGDAPAPGLYNLCYVNGFQSQPDAETFWTTSHPDLILRDAAGQPVIDTDWGEMLLDIRTPATRAALATIVGEWIAGCASSGFDAVEIDNLDSYARSGGLLTMDQAVVFMRLLANAAHAHGLAIAQKNSVELLASRSAMQTDFAVAEECNRYSECDAYVTAYGPAVLVIEYRRADFTTGCTAYPNLSIVLRDLDLVTPSSAGYVRDGC